MLTAAPCCHLPHLRRCAWLNHSSNPHAFIELVQQYPNVRLWFRCACTGMWSCKGFVAPQSDRKTMWPSGVGCGKQLAGGSSTSRGVPGCVEPNARRWRYHRPSRHIDLASTALTLTWPLLLSALPSPTQRPLPLEPQLRRRDQRGGRHRLCADGRDWGVQPRRLPAQPRAEG